MGGLTPPWSRRFCSASSRVLAPDWSHSEIEKLWVYRSGQAVGKDSRLENIWLGDQNTRKQEIFKTQMPLSLRQNKFIQFNL